MKIEIFNDGKNKYQSWEAKAVLNSDFNSGFSMLQIEAYGATEAEARANLNTVIQNLISDLTQVNQKLNAER